MTNDRTSRPRRPKSKFSRLWVPNQPGAWVMVLAPAVAGTLAGGTGWRGAWLTVAWLGCYCTQFTAARWLASHGRRRYLAPVLTYAGVTCALGLPLLIMEPRLLWWAPFYVVVAGASFLLAWMRRDRSLAAQTAAVLAAGGIGAAAAGMGAITRASAVVGIAFALFEFGQLLFVPSMAVGRAGRESTHAYYIASVALSAALACAGFAVHPLLGAAGVLLFARAAALPRLAAHGVIPPLAAAPSELVTSAVMVAAVAVAAG
ncbi:YwiC-like family protein [Bifidobacterium avesanii]|nr:YwiC-like family protein [Bifidobacterium avesanii]